jgi:phosphoglucomutase/phosphopentomutase
MLTFKLENGCVITLRTSGTEPKIKWHSEMAGASMSQIKLLLDRIIRDMTAEWLEPEKNGLIAQVG